MNRYLASLMKIGAPEGYLEGRAAEVRDAIEDAMARLRANLTERADIAAHLIGLRAELRALEVSTVPLKPEVSPPRDEAEADSEIPEAAPAAPKRKLILPGVR